MRENEVQKNSKDGYFLRSVSLERRVSAKYGWCKKVNISTKSISFVNCLFCMPNPLISCEIWMYRIDTKATSVLVNYVQISTIFKICTQRISFVTIFETHFGDLVCICPISLSCFLSSVLLYYKWFARLPLLGNLCIDILSLCRFHTTKL